MSSYQTWQDPQSPPNRWDSRASQFYNQAPPKPQSSYPTPPSTARPYFNSLPFTTTQRAPRYRWPPSPWVEDERQSVSREHSPSLPDLSDDEVPLRGSKDQQPIILEAGADSDDEDVRDAHKSDGSHRQNSLSGDSSGPGTPSDGPNSDERRFVFLPKEEEHDEEMTGNGERRTSYVRVRSGQPIVEPIRSKKEGLTVDPSIEPRRRAPSFTNKRDSTPYAFTPTSGKSAFPGDYLMSPSPLTPDGKLSSQYFETRGRHSALKGESGGKHRAMSNSSGIPNQRLPPQRNVSAMGLPGETRSPITDKFRHENVQSLNQAASRPAQRNVSPLGPSPSERRDSAIDSASETDSEYDSGVSTDEASPRRDRQTTSYSMSGSDLRRQSPILSREEPRPRPAPIRTSRAISPPQRSGRAFLSTPTTQDSRTYSSSTPNHNSFPQETRQKNPEPPRSSFATNTSTRKTPPATPRAEQNGFQSRSQSNSRPSTPPAASRPQAAKLAMPNNGPSHHSRQSSTPKADHALTPSTPTYPQSHLSSAEFQKFGPRNASRENGAPTSRQTSPLPSGSSDRLHGEDSKISVKPLSPGPRGRTMPLLPTTGQPVSRDSSYGQPSMSLSSQPRPAPIAIDTTARKAAEPEKRGSSEIPRFPAAVTKPTTKKAQPPGIPSLPPCPRPHLVDDYEHWSTLPGHLYFNVCRTCRQGLEDAGFNGHFEPSPPRSGHYRTRCDLSVPWVRMAWLLILQDRAKDINVINNITTTLYHEKPCPGNTGAIRNWQRLFDIESGRYVSNFDVCFSCIKSLEHLFPNLTGAFHPVPQSAAQIPRTCDFSTSSRRFPRYVDLLEQVSLSADSHRREPNMIPFTLLARQMASTRECAEDNQLSNQPWHFPPALPDFTVCEECYHDVVWPGIAAGGSEVAARFNRTLQMPPREVPSEVSCQLYSPRMREAFRTAAARGDWAGLRSVLLARVAKERELQARFRQISTWPEKKRMEEGGRLVAEWKRWA